MIVPNKLLQGKTMLYYLVEYFELQIVQLKFKSCHDCNVIFVVLRTIVQPATGRGGPRGSG